MPCTGERDRAEDKYAAYQIAQAEYDAAEAAFWVADGAAAGVCGTAIVTAGGGGFTGAACIAAVATLLFLTAEFEAARDKLSIASAESNTATGRYQQCLEEFPWVVDTL